MGSRLLSNVPLTRASRSPTFGHLEDSTESFLRHSICRRSPSYTSSTSPSLRVAWRDSIVREFRRLNNINALSTRLLNADARRFKSGRAQAKQERASSEARHLGDEPPLYDGKPALWARWVFLLLAVDMLFTGFSVDMVMRNWTRLIETPPTSAAPSPKPDSSSSESTTTSTGSSEKYELRPLWQRLGLASFEVVVGAAAGALILASRDRTVWRLRVRRVPISTLPPGRGGMRLPPPTSSSSSPPSSSSSSSGAQTINVLSLETGSGRTKRFLVRDCVLMPGRDLSELFLSIGGIRGRFVLPIQNDARVLGVSAADIGVGGSNVLKELLLASKENGDVALISSTAATGGADLENAHVAELRKALALAWIKVGGTLSVPRVSLQRPGDGWTSGPVVEGAR